MGNSPRCLFDSDIKTFLEKDKESIFGVLCDKYHGDVKLKFCRELLLLGKIQGGVSYLSMIFRGWGKGLM